MDSSSDQPNMQTSRLTSDQIEMLDRLAELTKVLPVGELLATEQAKELTSLIQQHHSHRFDIGFLIDQDAKHNESAWAKRLPAALEFLFPTPVPTPDP